MPRVVTTGPQAAPNPRAPSSRVCLFCGSAPGARPAYAEAARALGRSLAARGVGLVYGGTVVGLMGVAAEAALAGGGEVCGVLPRFMVDREIAHRGLTSLDLVDGMAERKARMAELSDAFITLPGGFGTLDELFEMLTWSLLGQQDKPVGLLDVDGYYASLLGFLDHATQEGLIRPAHRALLVVDTDVDRLLAKLLP